MHERTMLSLLCLLLIMIHNYENLRMLKIIDQVCPTLNFHGERLAMNRSITPSGFSNTTVLLLNFTAKGTVYLKLCPQLPNPWYHGTVQQPAQP